MCGIGAHAFVESRLSQIGPLRDRPGPEGSPPLPSRFLRHCDEQTVLGIHAVLAAIASLPAERRAYERHGVVAASCQVGRLVTALSLAQIRPKGSVSISPHIVPQCSLHSVAGAVSVALGMHGPNVGIGGGPDAVAEGLFAAISLVRPGGGADADGVWLIASDWAEEPAVDATGAAIGDPVCRAIALLVEPAAAEAAALELAIHFPAASVAGAGDAAADVPHDILGNFARAIDMCAAGGPLASWTVECPWPAEIRLSRRAAGAAPSRPLREAA